LCDQATSLTNPLVERVASRIGEQHETGARPKHGNTRT